VRENALYTATANLGNGGGVQKCKYGLGFAKLFFGERISQNRDYFFKK